MTIFFKIFRNFLLFVTFKLEYKQNHGNFYVCLLHNSILQALHY